jgi:ABC-type enterochelin transport system permease subunit
VGVDEDTKTDERTPQQRVADELLGTRNRAIVGIVFAALYIATFGSRGSLVAAIVSGVLGGLVLFLLLKEVDERRKRRRRRR